MCEVLNFASDELAEKNQWTPRRRDDGLALKIVFDLERDRMRFERMHARFHCVCAHRGRYDRDHACMHTRARHTHTIHDDTTGPEGGDCMLVGECCGETLTGLVACSRQLSQARPRSASTSLTLRPLHEGAATARWRSSKTRQTRIQFRHTPGEFGLTVYLRNLRNLCRYEFFGGPWPSHCRASSQWTVVKPRQH